MVLIQTSICSCISIPSRIEFSGKEYVMHKRRDHLGRFLPHDNQEEPFNNFHPKLVEPQRENDEDEPFENLFANIQAEITPSSSEESLHFNELFVQTQYQDKPLVIVIYQAPPLPSRMAMPTFPFPIPP